MASPRCSSRSRRRWSRSLLRTPRLNNDRTGVYLARLSRERAAAVVAYFARKGVAAKRMTAQGFGAEDPAGDNSTDDGKAENRRLELAVKSIGHRGAPAACLRSRRLHEEPARQGRAGRDDQHEPRRAALRAVPVPSAPATVANFVGLATGQKPWLDPHEQGHEGPAVLRRADLPPRDPRLYDPGGDPLRHRHRRRAISSTTRSRPTCTTVRARSRWRTPGRTRMAVSSSSMTRSRRALDNHHDLRPVQRGRDRDDDPPTSRAAVPTSRPNPS